MNIIKIIMMILGTFLYTSLVLSMGIGESIKEVPCYDKYGSEIQGLTCEKLNNGFPSELWRNLTLLIGLIFLNVIWWFILQ